ncbi:cation:proton antiporter [Escherichia coli]
MSGKFSKLWVAAEIWLFVLVGATVNIRVTFLLWLSGMLLITAALLFRMLGVWMSTLVQTYPGRERLFCMIAYLPKATVQAAIGAIPLAMGLQWGNHTCGGGSCHYTYSAAGGVGHRAEL